MLEHLAGDDDVERRVGERQRGGVGAHGLDAVGRGDGQGGLREVDADVPVARRDVRGEQAPAAPHVEQLARPGRDERAPCLGQPVQRGELAVRAPPLARELVVLRGVVANAGHPGTVAVMSEIAIVTGGNSGIGRACAVALARAGFDVGITWHAEEERARDAIAELEHVGVRAQARQVDLHDAAAGARVVDELAEALGGVDVLVNNAGYGEDGSFLELGLDDLRGVLEVDLVAPFACAQVAARRMVAAGRGGRIVNVTSVHEHVPMPESGPYVAAKHGLGGLTKVMALELAEHGILVNAVAPGQIATRMTGNEDVDPHTVERAGIPLGRPGDAHEIAAVVAVLAGPGATYMTGSSVVVDGGLVHIAAQHQS